MILCVDDLSVCLSICNLLDEQMCSLTAAASVSKADKRLSAAGAKTGVGDQPFVSEVPHQQQQAEADNDTTRDATINAVGSEILDFISHCLSFLILSLLMTKCIKRIRNLFEYALYKFTLYLLT